MSPDLEPEPFTAGCPVCGDRLQTRELAGALQWLTLLHRHTPTEHSAALIISRAREEL